MLSDAIIITTIITIITITVTVTVTVTMCRDGFSLDAFLDIVRALDLAHTHTHTHTLPLSYA
jgi:low affinity Fe/Cu permease